jgi:hypothetical protein
MTTNQLEEKWIKLNGYAEDFQPSAAESKRIADFGMGYRLAMQDYGLANRSKDTGSKGFSGIKTFALEHMRLENGEIIYRWSDAPDATYGGIELAVGARGVLAAYRAASGGEVAK